MEKKLQAKLDQKKFAKLFEQAAGEEIASLRSANIKQRKSTTRSSWRPTCMAARCCRPRPRR